MDSEMALRTGKAVGCGVALLGLLVPAAIAGYWLHWAKWLAIIPAALLILILLIAAIPSRRRVTAAQFANELEAHLLGTESQWDWDDVTSVRLADPRLERI